MAVDPIHFVLIDCENVQPKDLQLLKDGPFRVKVFLGKNQTKIPVEWAAALQPLGKNADYVYLESGGPTSPKAVAPSRRPRGCNTRSRVFLV